MARKSEPLKYRIFVGDRPLEELTPDEREVFRDRVVQRMGEVFNDYFSLHPEVYAKFESIEPPA